MLDIKLFREDPERVRADLKKREKAGTSKVQKLDKFGDIIDEEVDRLIDGEQ